MLPLLWLGLTSVKPRSDAVSTQPRFVPALSASEDASFAVTGEAYATLSVPLTGSNQSFYAYLLDSAIVGLLSTAAAIALGTACAYGFSRFRIAGANDWLFFILSTRFLPPLAVVAPILLMYRQLEIQNTHAGLILLYTAFNLSLAVWLMKGFIDEIPKAYEEAALVDGYTHLHIFRVIILTRVRTGMAVTGVFCLISAWNEYAFALTLNNAHAVTVPVYFAGLQGNIQGVPWPQIAAGVLVFVTPIVIFTVLVRRHLLRGVTFGTIKQ
ncbi:MAG: carbohydrate ABC transporter permease [candidate division Zixibacteria bacterium]|nr:carbohydrate ABC transporter permease [candidate division Zixibacteria bacterium]